MSREIQKGELRNKNLLFCCKAKNENRCVMFGIKTLNKMRVCMIMIMRLCLVEQQLAAVCTTCMTIVKQANMNEMNEWTYEHMKKM